MDLGGINGLVLLILIGVAMIDGKLWKVTLAQRDHNQKVQSLLSEIRDRLPRQ